MEPEIRLLSHVTRWSIVAVNRPQTLADHQYYVALLSWRMVKELNIEVPLDEVLVGALTHDIPETVSSDIPSPVLSFIKAECPSWRRWLQGAVKTLFPWFVEDQSAAVRWVVSITDYLESILYLMEEKKRGNTGVSGHIATFLTGLEEKFAQMRKTGSHPVVVDGKSGIAAIDAVENWCRNVIYKGRRENRTLAVKDGEVAYKS